MVRKLQQIFALTEKGARDLIKGILWSAIANLSLMLPVGLLIMVLDQMLQTIHAGGYALENVGRYTLLALIVVVIIFVLHWYQYRSVYIATYNESANRRVNLAEKLRQLPLSFFGKRDLTDLTNTIMADCSALEMAFSHQIPELFGSFLSTLLIIIGLVFVNPTMALAVLWVLPVALLLAVGSKKWQDRWGRQSILAKRRVSDGIQECLETVRDIKSCNQQADYRNALFEKLRQAEAAAIRSELMTGVLITSAQMFLRLGLATTILVGAKIWVQEEITLLTYLLFLIAAARLYDPLSIVLINIGALFNAQLQISRMKEIENQPVQQGAMSYQPKGYDIVFDQVAFAYNDEDTVLRNVSFTAHQGQVTALVGPSGGGKSTTAKLAARFWDVTGGRITLGGVDVTTVDPEVLLESYAIVFQDVVLFNDTIMENIRLGRKAASDEAVLAAARAARCDSFIERLPQGYQTMIGENGSTLSGGERQRISIARALLKDAPVILLDEATASLDVENETEIQSALSQLIADKTVLVIAHRMRTVAAADKIIVLADGAVAEQGTPDELMAHNGIYRHMVELQQQSSGWTLGNH